MRVVIVGASGIIGREVVAALGARHEVVRVGFLSQYPNPASMATGPLNAAIDTFVMNAAPLLSRGIRLNIVSPAPVVDPGQERVGLVTAADTARFYVESIEGDFTGRVLRAWGGLPVLPGQPMDHDQDGRPL